MVIRTRLFAFEAHRDGIFVGFGACKRRPSRGGGLEQRRLWQVHWTAHAGLVVN